MTLVTSGGKLVLKDGKLGSGRECCCGGCSGPCGPAGGKCFDWTVQVSSGTFGNHTVRSTRLVGGCGCNDVYEIGDGPWFSGDGTQYLEAGGSISLVCDGDECKIDSGGFGLGVFADDGTPICGLWYKANEVGQTIGQVPFNVSFSLDANDCNGEASATVTVCVFRGPLAACGEGPALEDPATFCAAGCECVDGECVQPENPLP